MGGGVAVGRALVPPSVEGRGASEAADESEAWTMLSFGRGSRSAQSRVTYVGT